MGDYNLSHKKNEKLTAGEKVVFVLRRASVETILSLSVTSKTQLYRNETARSWQSILNVSFLC